MQNHNNGEAINLIIPFCACIIETFTSILSRFLCTSLYQVLLILTHIQKKVYQTKLMSVYAIYYSHDNHVTIIFVMVDSMNR